MCFFSDASYRELKDYRTNCVDPDMAAHFELPRLGKRCSQTPEVLVENSRFKKKDMLMFFRADKEH